MVKTPTNYSMSRFTGRLRYSVRVLLWRIQYWLIISTKYTDHCQLDVAVNPVSTANIAIHKSPYVAKKNQII
jgi:hypothetical protein